MSATIKDVAKKAGVSASTVSRVISNNPKISEETRNKVFSIIEELNYHPNVIARSLANKATKMLGLILPNNEEDLFKNPFFIQIMTGISISCIHSAAMRNKNLILLKTTLTVKWLTE